jgi:hypothetical protein
MIRNRVKRERAQLADKKEAIYESKPLKGADEPKKKTAVTTAIPSMKYIIFTFLFLQHNEK